MKTLLVALFIALSLIIVGLYTGFLSFVNRFDLMIETFHRTWEALGTSAIFFGVDFLLFVYFLTMQKVALKEENLINIRFYNMLTQLSISLFFGIGVIYTAIGMQNALIGAISGLDAQSAAAFGAWEILSKLVNGGIITALMTTIVGGVGGYIMRIVKQFYIAKELDIYLLAQDTVEQEKLYGYLSQMNNSLELIQKRL